MNLKTTNELPCRGCILLPICINKTPSVLRRECEQYKKYSSYIFSQTVGPDIYIAHYEKMKYTMEYFKKLKKENKNENSL